MKKQRNYLLLAFLIPLIIAMLFSCSAGKNGYGCPAAKQGARHDRNLRF